MEMLFQNIVGGIMIDAFTELKDEDYARNEDKKGFCYICGMDKAAVPLLSHRYKEVGLASISTHSGTSSGTIFTTSIFSKKRTQLITPAFNLKLTSRLKTMM